MTDTENRAPPPPTDPIRIDFFRLKMASEGLNFAIEHLENVRRLLKGAPGPQSRALAREVGKAATRAERAAALVRKAIEAQP